MTVNAMGNEWHNTKQRVKQRCSMLPWLINVFISNAYASVKGVSVGDMTAHVILHLDNDIF